MPQPAKRINILFFWPGNIFGQKNKGKKILEFKSWLTRTKTAYSRLAFIVQYYTKKFLFLIRKRAPLLKKLHLDSFPAIHIKRMDWLDFILKFSSELLILVLSLMVAGLNFFYFAGNRSDESLAASLLKLHPAQNTKLYALNSSVVTVVDSGGFLPQAYAQDFTGLESINAGSPAAAGDGSDIVMGDETTFLAPNPDSVQSLIAKQIKIYQTQSGDSLKSIAQTFGISQQTIMWANKLTSTTIKPGWQLLILPTDGVLYQATDNDTLPDIANKFNPEKYNPNKQIREDAAAKLLDTIVSYNAKANAEDISGGDLIIVPGGAVTSPPAPPAPKAKPKPKTSTKDKSKVGGSGPVDEVMPPQDTFTESGGHAFPRGYCTWYVAQKMGGKVSWGGNAKAWIANSKAAGAVVDRDPAAGTILVTNESRRFGHVAYVENVTDHSVIVSEMNFSHFGKVDTREIPLDSSVIKGFIHP